jgi:thiamine biosynthesis lipoprotein
MRRCRPALGTFVSVELHDLDDDGAVSGYALAAIDEAFTAIDTVQSLMSFHDPRSELSRLNATAHRSPQRVSAQTFAVLSAARDLFERTDRRFDCAVGARLAHQDMLPNHHDADWLHAALDGTSADLELHPDGCVSYRRPLCLDLGGIAKGYAVDRAIDTLARCGIASAVVNAGGDLRVLGATERAIHIRDPHDASRLRFAGSLADGAIATSASYYATALIDPTTAEALVDERSYSVIAPTCMIADGLTKALAVSREAAPTFLAHYGAEALVL